MKCKINIFRKLIFFNIALIFATLLIASCSFAGTAIKSNMELADIIAKITGDNYLKTSNLTGIFGNYKVEQQVGYGAIFRWNQKQTSDSFIIDEVSGSNWHKDSVGILRELNLKIHVGNCYDYKTAALEFGLTSKQIMPPNPHSIERPQLMYLSIKNYSWGDGRYFFDKNQCLQHIRFMADQKDM